MSKQTLRYNRFLLEQPPTVLVDLINTFTFANYAKAYAHMGFVPILKEIYATGFQVKLYLDDNKIKNKEILYFFVTFYFFEKFPEYIKHTNCSQILIYADTWLDSETIAKANSLDELEQALLKILPDETPVIHANQGANLEQVTFPGFFFNINGFILDGYLELDYWERTQFKEGVLKNSYYTINRVTHMFFLNTGGQQPDSINPKDINKFFQGNCAKWWAMHYGYLPTFTGYENGEIQFELITDPRCTGFNWQSLCNKIAIQYKKYVNLLKDATSFKVMHFVANDIIGFYLKADDSEKFSSLNNRVQAVYKTLPQKTRRIHDGKIN